MDNFEVAIIDDDPIFQLIMAKVLLKILPSIKLLQFGNGVEALQYFKDHMSEIDKLPHLIFLDLYMPVLTGWQFLDLFKLLNIKEYNPVIYMVSSSLNQVDIDRANSIDILKAYLLKPVPLDTFKSILDNFC